ncbi:MAG: alanyl-tRNA synthetase, partial [Actinomycetota bacterium]|nr:alanyl-tRNA synthetase [Actinomycetota bacterium]
WELVTEDFGLDGDRLWASVFETDDEAFEIWRDVVGMPSERIVRLGKEDNFWSMGVAGPCGPCSELCYDLGDEYGPPAPNGPADNDERYLEIWNLVFMENDCNAAIEPVAELPKKNIDTGAGLERFALVLQDVKSVFETDLLAALIERASQVTKKSYGVDEKTDVGLRILADHGRSVTFMVADGILPSNEERGYVLRRIMRRAMRHARLIGFEGEVLPALADGCVELMGDVYPEIKDRRDVILDVAAHEEERFSTTLKQGTALLEERIAGVTSAKEKVLPGDVAFKLHDTFGFPIDMTREIAQEAGLGIDSKRFEELMSEQRERARAARKTELGRITDESLGSLREQKGPTEFVGYEFLVTEARVIAISDGTKSLPVAQEGDEVELILDRTVFYAEGGGQVGDTGVIESVGGRARVDDTQRLVPGLTGHRARIVSGEIAVGDEVRAAVDAGRRHGSERAHTATHILHWILRDRLGEHASQAGSLVEPGRLRFDFHHYDALDPVQLRDISQELGERVLLDDGVRAYETSYDFAKSIGAMAIFGEKYGDFVRVVEVGDYSKELCGGTHVPHTTQIATVVVTGESSVGSNLRRIEALVGREGLAFLEQRAAVLERAAATLRSAPEDVAERVEKLVAANKEMEHRLTAVERQGATEDAGELASTAVELPSGKLVVARRDAPVDAVRGLAQTVKSRLGTGIVVLASATDGKANLVASVSKDLVSAGVSARDLLGPGAELLGGGAGGKPDLAISGGPRADRIDDALAAVADRARVALSG